MKTCTSCLREKKVFLVDLNLFKKTRKGKIRFRQCKKQNWQILCYIIARQNCH